MTATILDPSPALSGAELTSGEEDLIARVDARRHNNLGVAAALSGAFLVYRLYMRRRLREAMKDQDPSNFTLVAGATMNAFIPRFVQVIAPQLVLAYLEGVKEADVGQVPHELLVDLAEKYAEDLGGHLNEVSIEAAMSGYQAQLNRKLVARKALENVITAYGVPPRTMNSLVSIWTSPDPKLLTTTVQGSLRDRRAAAVIDKAVARRGSQVGATEAWGASRAGKQLVWSYGIEKGFIPAGATKVWRTAHDERVCPVCGPLDRVEVPINEAFSNDGGKYWTPPVHPSCRCDIHLAVDILESFRPVRELEAIGKNIAGDPYDRDRKGRFARVEARVKDIPKVSLQAITLPDIEVPEKELPPLPGTEAPVKVELGGKISLGGKHSLQKVSLGGKVSLEGAQAEPVSLRTAHELPKRSLPKVGLPSESAIKVGLGIKDTGRSSDNWIFLREPLYTVLAPYARTGEMVYIDEHQVFYRYGDVKKQLEDYWAGWMDSEIATFNEGDVPHHYTYFEDRHSNGRWNIDTQAYQELLEWYVRGEEKPKSIPLSRTIRGREEVYMVNAGTLAEWFDLDNTVQDSTPTMMVVTYLNTEQGQVDETKYHGSARNPGNWRIVSAANHGSWDVDTNVPYELAHFEPDDLYPDQKG